MSVPEQNEYGPIYTEYEGVGLLRSQPDHEANCKFRAFQLRDGAVIALCEFEYSRAAVNVIGGTEISLIGKMHDGHRIAGEGLSECNYLPPLDTSKSGIYAAYRVDSLTIFFDEALESDRSKFLLTNLTLFPMPLFVEHPAGKATIRPVENYDPVLKRLQVTKAIEATVEMEVNGTDADRCMAAADDICYVLSVARGTKVNWISVSHEFGDKITRANYSSRITKRYVPLPTIDYRNQHDTDEYLGIALKTYLDRRDKWALPKGLIDAYLDAKSEGDFLQVRGVKLVVAIETLKSVFVSATGRSEFISSKSDFAQIKQSLKDEVSRVLHQAHWNKHQCSSLYRNLIGLNRVSFGEILREMLEYFALEVSAADQSLFLECRNSLVHNCKFYCESPDRRREGIPPHSNPTAEFKWLVHLVDRLFLRLLGYRGPYIDWSCQYPGRKETF